MREAIGTYKNGNYKVLIFSDGTKIRYNKEDTLIPSRPESFDIKITNRCNRNCTFCVFNNNDTDMSFEKFKNIINIISKLDFDKLHINGGEPLINREFKDMIKYAKEVFPDKKIVLGSNLVAMEKNPDLLEFAKNNFDEICVGCDSEHKNIEILEKLVPELKKDSNVQIIVNTLLEYCDFSLMNRLEKLKKECNIILVTNHVYHKISGPHINDLKEGLCTQGGEKVIMIQENGDVYRCFNCCIPDDKEMNIYDSDFLEKINIERNKHYKFCGWCKKYEP